MCHVDGKTSIAVVIAADHELVHFKFNSLWCHLFYTHSQAKGMFFLQIGPSKHLTISALADRVFPAIKWFKLTKDQPSPFITAKTVAYVFALIIDSVILHHKDGPHSRALVYETALLKDLVSAWQMTVTPDEIRAELRDFLALYYENVLKVPGAGGLP
jgi:hypothetical protein